MAGGRVTVTFDKPGFFLADTRLIVTLAGETIHDGSFRSGFSATRELPAGVHDLETTIQAGPVARKKRYAVAVDDGASVTATLEYSRFWGNFKSKLRLA